MTCPDKKEMSSNISYFNAELLFLRALVRAQNSAVRWEPVTSNNSTAHFNNFNQEGVGPWITPLSAARYFPAIYT